MDIWLTFLCILSPLTLIHILLSLTKLHKRNKLPPGPTPLPIIGNLHQLGKNPHQSLAELANIYGPIMSLKLGRITTLVISSSSAAKEVLQKQDLAFSSRFVPDAFNAHNHAQFSVGWLPAASPQWKILRKIMVTNIFSNNRLDANQHLRSRKVKELIVYCEECSKTKKAVNIGQLAFQTTFNLLSNTVFSKDLIDSSDEESAKEMKELVNNLTREGGKPNLVDYFPFRVLKKLDMQKIRQRMMVYHGKILEVFDGLIKERMELMKDKRGVDGYGDVLDACLHVMEEKSDEINTHHIRHLISDLFMAGTDTTSSTLEWGMAEILHNPHIFKKAKAELDTVIGKGKAINEVDIPQLPYLQCIVKETLRLHPAAPLLIPRKTEYDVELYEYTIPKDSQVLINVWATARDSCHWEDALSFKPERFLNSNIDVRGRDFEVIPFGGGRRICPGLPLAVRMVAVMLGSLVNSFDWELDGGIVPEEMDMEEKFGITLQKSKPLCVIPIQLTV